MEVNWDDNQAFERDLESIKMSDLRAEEEKPAPRSEQTIRFL